MDDLPSEPGLLRRLAYSRSIRLRNVRRNERRNAYSDINDYQNVVGFNCEIVCSGLNIKNLVKNSKVLNTDEKVKSCN